MSVTLHFISFALIIAPSHIGWYYGNLVVYLNSYWYATQNPTHFDSHWVLSVFIISWITGRIIAGKMIERIDRRIIMFIGVLCVDTGMFSSYFSVQHSQIAFVVTFGGMNGVGIGFALTEIIARIPHVITKRFGMAFALLANYFIVGAALFQGIQTWYINPGNMEADEIVFGHFKVFSEKSVIDHVPSIFLLLGVVTSVLNWSGFLLSVMLMCKRKELKGKESIPETKATEFSSLIQPGRNRRNNEENQGVEAKTSSASSIEEKNSQLLGSSCNEGGGYNFPTINQWPTPHDTKKSCPQDSASSEQQDVSNCRDLNEIQMLKTLVFYIVWITFFANEGSYIALLNFYKTFGELYIHDDHFLTHMGMALLCVVFVMRIVWAMLIDTYGFRPAQVALNSMMSLSFLFYYFTPQINRWLFAVWTSAIAALCSAVYLNFPVMTLKLFGKTHFTSNYALVGTSTIFLNMVAPPVFQILIKHFGWAAIFIAMGAMNLAAFIIVVVGLPNCE